MPVPGVAQLAARRRLVAPTLFATVAGQSIVAFTTTQTVTLTTPANLANGDVLYAIISAVASSGGLTFTTPTSGGTWTLLLTVTETADTRAVRVYRRVVTNAAGEPANMAFTTGGTISAGGVGNNTRLLVVRGASAASPEGGVTPTGSHSAGTPGSTATAPTITPAAVPALLICWYTDQLNFAATFASYTNSVTEYVDTSGIAVASKTLTSGGAAGASAATISASRLWTAISLTAAP